MPEWINGVKLMWFAIVRATLKFRRGLVKLAPMSHVTFVYYMTHGAHPQQASVFIERLATGAGLKKGDSILLFRERMKDMVGQKHRLLQSEKVALLIKTWNAFLGERPIALLRWKREVEVFPAFDEEGARAPK